MLWRIRENYKSSRRFDGTIFFLKVTPALHSNYEVYKSVAHTFLQVAVLITPYLSNTAANTWMEEMKRYKDRVEVTTEALRRSNDETLNTCVIFEMLEAVSRFLGGCLDHGEINFERWIQMNRDHFSNLRLCMDTATKLQAEANVTAMLKWKARLGAVLWRDLHVIIPSVWPVAGNNPRRELFRSIMDADRRETHIISSEFPRGIQDCRRLLGRVVGDRAIGRLVFGDDTMEMKMKTYFLSSPTDVVMDDALYHLRNEVKKHQNEI